MNGDSAGPRSRRPSTRQAMAKAKLPKVSCSTMPEYSGRGSHSIGYFLSRDQLKVPPSTISAADRIAVAAEEFGERMHDDVGAVIDRLAQIGRGERVVDDQRHAGLARDIGDRLDVGDDAAGIGDRLDEDALVFGVTAFSNVPMSSGSAHTTFQPKFL